MPWPWLRTGVDDGDDLGGIEDECASYTVDIQSRTGGGQPAVSGAGARAV